MPIILDTSIIPLDTFAIKVLTTITPTLSRPVNVLSYKTPAGYYTRLFIKKIDDSIDNAVLIEGAGHETTEEINSEVTWEMNFNFFPGLCGPGVYEIIPYFRVIQEGLPEELISSIDENAVKLANQYLKIPYRQQVTYLKVTP